MAARPKSENPLHSTVSFRLDMETSEQMLALRERKRARATEEAQERVKADRKAVAVRKRY